MKRISRYLPLVLLLAFAQFASAQGAFDAYLGFGSTSVKSNGAGIDSIQSPTNPLGSCDPTSGDPFCLKTGSLSGVFMTIGGDVMVHPRYGFGTNITFQPAKQDYGALQYRQMFYDFNGILAPLSTKRASLRIEGGIGAARTGFSLTQSACVGTAVCSTSAQSVGSATHFQVHVGVGVQLYLTSHVFIRPQFDYHYVPGLTDQFGSTSVPQGSIYLGYNFGEK